MIAPGGARDPDTVGPVNDWAQIRAGTVLYEDDAALVLNKAGLAVMGERHDTDLVRLAEEAGEKLYPAHRIDKVTSGVLLLAKDLRLHGDLTRQFNRRTVDKVYLAITATTGLPARGTIELPLSVGRKNRVRVAANRAAIAYDPAQSRWSVPRDEQFQEVRTYPSTTTFLTVAGDGEHTVLAVSPVTGRRHQIRVHLAWIGHPIEGDPLFAGRRPPPAGRCCTRGGSGSTRPGPPGGASRSRRRRAPTSGAPCPAARSRCRAGTPSADTDAVRQAGRPRNAERMPGRIGVDAQRLVSGSPERSAISRAPRATARSSAAVSSSAAVDVQVQVHLLRHRAIWPGHLGQRRHLLDRDADRPGGILQHQPVLAAGSGSPGAGGSSPGRYRQPSSLPVELGQFPASVASRTTCLNRGTLAPAPAAPPRHSTPAGASVTPGRWSPPRVSASGAALARGAARWRPPGRGPACGSRAARQVVPRRRS